MVHDALKTEMKNMHALRLHTLTIKQFEDMQRAQEEAEHGHSHGPGGHQH
jgi:hypothetical protein